jgi:hypothetical protein
LRNPEFIIIGSQKAGTSSLWNALRRHPEVFMPAQKEVNYFFDAHRFTRGPEWYLAHFAEAAEGVVCGEASPGYVCHPQAPGRIADLLPDCKLILTVREPIARAWSQYWDNRRWLNEASTFEALVEAPRRHDFDSTHRNYFTRGLYSLYIGRLLARFPRQQLLVVVFDDLRRDPAAVFRRVFDFIGVDGEFTCPEMFRATNARFVFHNPLFRFFFHRPAWAARLPMGARRLLRIGRRVDFVPHAMAPAARARLETHFAPYNAELAALLGVDLDWGY